MLLTSDEHCIGRLVDDARFQIIAPAVSAHHCKIYRKRIATEDTEQQSENYSVFLKDSRSNILVKVPLMDFHIKNILMFPSIFAAQMGHI